MANTAPGGIGIPFPTKIVNDPEREYVLVNGYSSTHTRMLSDTLDEVEIEINLDTYDRMENDTVIAKCKKILITNVLTDDIMMSPGATEDEVTQDEYETYLAVMALCERTVSGLDRPLRETLEQLLGNGITYGHGIAEIVSEYRKDGGSKKPLTAPLKDNSKPPKLSLWQRLGFSSAADTANDPLVKRPILSGEKIRLMPKSIKVKSRGSCRFVVDEYLNVLGIAPRRRGRINDIKFNEIVDREKFMVFTSNRKDEDPRGKSAYRPAFNWYNLKSQIPTELLRFILEETVPKAVGTLAEGAAPFEYERDPHTNAILYADDGTTPKMLTASESFARQISGFRGGSGAVIPFGAKLEPFKKGTTTDANVFPTIIKVINDEIENCILLQTLAQSEGAHQARSAAQQVAELLYNLVFWIKWGLAQTLIYDLFSTVVKDNLGEWAIAYLPKINLGDFVRRDWVKELEAYSDGYFKGLLDDTQRPEIMANLNLPKPGPSRAEVMAQPVQAQPDVNGNTSPNPANRPDKQPGSQDRNKGNGTEKKNVNKPNAIHGISTGNILGHQSRWFRRS